MANVLDVLASEELGVLQELADDLEGTLSVIAFTKQPKLIEFIRQRQKELADQYENSIQEICQDIDYRSIEANMFAAKKGISGAITRVINAYQGFQDIFYFGESSDIIKEEAENILYENLILPD